MATDDGAFEPFWIRFIENLRGLVGRPYFETWLSRLACRMHGDDFVDLVTPNSFVRAWIQGHYLTALREAAVGVDGRPRDVRLLLAADLEKPELATLPKVGALTATAEAPDSPAAVATLYATSGSGASSLEAPLTPPAQETSSQEVQVLPEAQSGDDAAKGRDAVPFWAAAPASSVAGSSPGGNTGAEGPPLVPLVSCSTSEASSTLGDSSKVLERGAEGGTAFNPASLEFFQENSDFVLNEAFTFPNFVIGPSNELACAAAKAVAEFPAGPYNPLFLYASSGLGKTHLLQAICFAVLRSSTPRRILYLSSENFVNQFILAVSTGDLPTFRYKYRKVDMLLIDDIQFLEGKTRTQEEFFHTFNTLYNAKKQIVMSSDRPPKEMATLQERLVSRFGWGMVTAIEAPCLETRGAIAKHKARLRGVDLTPDVAYLLAELIDTNIRDLEGAVTKLLGYSNLMGKRIGCDLVHEALQDLLPNRPQVSVQEVLEVVAREFGVPARELQSKRRSRWVVLPRHIGIYLARKHTRLSLEEIGGFFGGRDHATVLYAIKKVEELIATETETAEIIRRLSAILERGSH